MERTSMGSRRLRRHSLLGRQSSDGASPEMTDVFAPASRRLSISVPGVRPSPTAPLYLFRAPGLQARIGLRKEVFAPGETVDGTLILYRDFVGDDHPRVSVEHVDVNLFCEVTRRKENTSFKPHQEFRPQNIAHQHMSTADHAASTCRYSYTKSLVPLSQKWAHGPWEARYHTSCHTFASSDTTLPASSPYHAPIRATLSTASSSPGSRTDLRHFRVTLPSSLPASHVWDESKKGAAVEIRYRLAAAAYLSGEPSARSRTDSVLLAEAVLLVTHNAPSAHAAPAAAAAASSPRVARRVAHLPHRGLMLSLGRSVAALSAPLHVSVTLSGAVDGGSAKAEVALVERVSHGGRARAQRRVDAVQTARRAGAAGTTELTFTVAAPAAGRLAPDAALGPLVVTHAVEACLLRGGRRELLVRVPLTLLRGGRIDEDARLSKLRAKTHMLRKQPSILYYYQDEFPLFPNLDYENERARSAHSGIAAAVSAGAIAARLPFLTYVDAPGAAAAEDAADGADEDVCMVCLNALREETVTRLAPCGHVLHLRCAQTWLRHVGQSAAAVVCPMCKQGLR